MESDGREKHTKHPSVRWLSRDTMRILKDDRKINTQEIERVDRFMSEDNKANGLCSAARRSVMK